MTDITLSPPSPSRRERKRDQMANHLAATAFQLFETHGYEVVTMEQIAAEADVAKGTLYKYFPVKEALLAHQFHEEIATGMIRLRSAMERQPTFAARMKCLLHESAKWNKTRRVYLPHYLRFQMATLDYGLKGSGPRHESSGARGIFEALFRAGQDTGEVRSDLAAADLAVMFECMCLGAILIWLHRSKRDLKQEFEFALDVVLNGATARRALRREKK